MPSETQVRPYLNRVTRLRLRMSELQVKNKDLSAQTGIPQSRLSEYSLGRKSIPAKHIIPLAQALGCSPRDMLGWADASDFIVIRGG